MAGGKQRFEVGAVDLHYGAEEMARERAEAWFTEQEEQAKGKGFWARAYNSVVVQNLFREAFRQHQLRQAREDILKTRTWYGNDEVGHEAQRGAEQALVEHLVTLDDDSRLEKQTEFRSAANEELRAKMQAAILRAVEQKEMTAESFAEEVKEIASQAFSASGKATPWTANNAWGVVERLRALHNHGRGLNLANIEIGFTIGRLRTDARTEQEQTEVDQLIEHLNNRHGWVRSLVNETSVAVGIAALSSTVSLAGKTVAGKVAFMVGGLVGATAVSASIAAYKEGRRLDRERWLHARQHAAGLEERAWEEERAAAESEEVLAARQEKLRQLQRERAELRPWHLLRRRAIDAEINTLTRREYSSDRRRELQRTQVETASAQEALRFLEDVLNAPQEHWENPAWRQQTQQQLVEMDAREAASITLRRDLFRYAADIPVPVQRLALLKARATLRARLRKEAGNARDWRSDFRAAVVAQRLVFEQQAEQKDQEYVSYRAAMQQLAGRQAAVSGLVVGTVVQTALGVVSSKVTSPLEALAKYVSAWWSPEANAPDAAAVVTAAPPADVREQFQQAVQTAEQASVPTPPPQEASLPPKLEPQTIVRDVFYSNKYSGRIADHNELQLTWGKTTDQSYVLDISGMKDEQSWYNGHPKMNPATAIKSGEAVIVLVPEGAAREQVIIIPVNASGQAIIEKTSVAGQQLFGEERGEPVFKGFRVEAALRLGGAEGEKQHFGILASFLGDGSWKYPHAVSIEEVASTPTPIEAPRLERETVQEMEQVQGVPQTNVQPEIVPRHPHVLPLRGRTGMRNAWRRQQEEDDSEAPELPHEPPLPIVPPDDIPPPPRLIASEHETPLAEVPVVHRAAPEAGTALVLSAEAQRRRKILDTLKDLPQEVDINELYTAVFGHDRNTHAFTDEERETAKLMDLFTRAPGQKVEDALVALGSDMYAEYRRRENGRVIAEAWQTHGVFADFVRSSQVGKAVGGMRTQKGIRAVRAIIDRMEQETNIETAFIVKMRDQLREYEDRLQKVKRDQELFRQFEKKYPEVVATLDFGKAMHKLYGAPEEVQLQKKHWQKMLAALRELIEVSWIDRQAVDQFTDKLVLIIAAIPSDAYPDRATEWKIKEKLQRAVDYLDEAAYELQRRKRAREERKAQGSQPAVDWSARMNEQMDEFLREIGDEEKRWQAVGALVEAAYQAVGAVTRDTIFNAIIAGKQLAKAQKKLLKQEIGDYLVAFAEQQGRAFGQT